MVKRKDWYNHLVKQLEKHGIDHEIVHYQIDRSLNGERDGEWRNYLIEIRSLRFVHIERIESGCMDCH